MAEQLYRVMKCDFEKGTECMGVFNERQCGSIHKVALQIARRERHDMSVDMKVGDGWQTADLIGKGGMVYFDEESADRYHASRFLQAEALHGEVQ